MRYGALAVCELHGIAVEHPRWRYHSEDCARQYRERKYALEHLPVLPVPFRLVSGFAIRRGTIFTWNQVRVGKRLMRIIQLAIDSGLLVRRADGALDIVDDEVARKAEVLP